MCADNVFGIRVKLKYLRSVVDSRGLKSLIQLNYSDILFV